MIYADVSADLVLNVVTTQRERGRCWCPIYICLWTKNSESYFSDRLTLSNIYDRTSRRIYRLALPLRAPETLSLSSKSRIFLYNAHLALFVLRITQFHSCTNSSVDIVF